MTVWLVIYAVGLTYVCQVIQTYESFKLPSAHITELNVASKRYTRTSLILLLRRLSPGF